MEDIVYSNIQAKNCGSWSRYTFSALPGNEPWYAYGEYFLATEGCTTCGYANSPNQCPTNICGTGPFWTISLNCTYAIGPSSPDDANRVYWIDVYCNCLFS